MTPAGRLVALGFLGWLITYASRTVLYPMLPFIAADFGLSNTVTGAVVSAYFVTFAAVQIPSGVIGARIGYKSVLVLAYSLAALALAAVALFATNYTWLVLLVALYGLGAGVYATASWSVILANLPGQGRGRLASFVSSGMSFGLAVGLILAGSLYAATQSWRLPFLALAAPGLLLALAFARLEPRSARAAPASVGDSLRILQDRQLLALCLATFFSIYAFNVVLAWRPTFLTAQRDMGTGQAGLYTGLVTLGAVPGALPAGRMSDRIGRREMSLIQFPLTAAIVLALPALRTPGLLALDLVLYGLVGKLAWDAVWIPWLSDHMALTQPGQFGAALGRFNLFAMLGAVLAPTVTGWLRDTTGALDAAFYLAGAVMISFVLLALYREAVQALTPNPLSRPNLPNGRGEDRPHLAPLSRGLDGRGAGMRASALAQR